MDIRRSTAVGLSAVLLGTGLAVVGSTAVAAPAAAAVGGPVIIGGDDLTDHGHFDGVDNQDGWRYIENALRNVKGRVTRSHDGTVAVLGAEASTGTSGDAGGAAHHAAPKAGLTPEYVNGDAAIDAYLDGVAAGTKRPAVLYVTGDGAFNDLGDGPGDEGQALADNATTMADFVNGGGGLLSHGSEYRWLFALLPGARATGFGSADDLYKTPAGNSAFPTVSEQDFNAGPWHNHFEGDFGGLEVLVRSRNVDDDKGQDAAVILGGAATQLPGSISLDPATATNPVYTSHTVRATTRNADGSLASGKSVTFKVLSGPNTGKTGSGTTSSSGTTNFTYADTAGLKGSDTIEASFVDDTGTTRKATATKTWTSSKPVCTVERFNTTPRTARATFTDAERDIVKIEITRTSNATWVLDGTAGSTLKTYPRPGVTGKVLTTRRVDNTRTGIVDVRITDGAGNVTTC